MVFGGCKAYKGGEYQRNMDSLVTLNPAPVSDDLESIAIVTIHKSLWCCVAGIIGRAEPISTWYSDASKN